MFGRAATDAELKAGLAFLAAEPLKRLRRAKNAKEKQGRKDARSKATAERRRTPKTGDEADDADEGGRGMMAGRDPGAVEEAIEARRCCPSTRVGAVREGPAQLERVPVRGLTWRHTNHGNRSPGATRSAGWATASACWRSPSLVGESIVGRRLAGAGRLASIRASCDHPARAKRVIFLFMNGGLSQVDSFDPKPMLDKYHGQPLPGGAVATERKTGALMRSPFAFKKYGQSGIEVSELFPHVGECADDICFIRSMYTDIPNHEPSMLMMNTGHTPGGPAVDRIVADLRARHRQQEPAGLRRALSRTCRRRSGRRCGTARSCRRCTRARSSPTRSRSRPSRT